MKTSKRLTATALVAIILLGWVGCGPKKPGTPPESPAVEGPNLPPPNQPADAPEATGAAAAPTEGDPQIAPVSPASSAPDTPSPPSQPTQPPTEGAPAGEKPTAEAPAQ